jgi:peroxiredoxin
MEEVPLLKALHAAYASRIVLIGISIDEDLAQTDRTIREKGMTYPILADGKGFDGPIPTAYHIQGTPELFLLDRDGKIFARPASAKQIEASLKDALR